MFFLTCYSPTWHPLAIRGGTIHPKKTSSDQPTTWRLWQLWPLWDCHDWWGRDDIFSLTSLERRHRRDIWQDLLQLTRAHVAYHPPAMKNQRSSTQVILHNPQNTYSILVDFRPAFGIIFRPISSVNIALTKDAIVAMSTCTLKTSKCQVSCATNW